MRSIALSSVTDVYSNYDFEDSLAFPGDASPAAAPQPIYGRSAEKEALLNVYHRLLTTSPQMQIVLVHGESGCGKTALVDTLRHPVCNMSGYFVAGKYFQLNGTVQEPYSAIMAAFSDLCDLMIQSGDCNDEQRREVATRLGSDAQVLVKSISNFAPFLADDFGAGESTETSFAKFKIACKSFLHIMSSNTHPVVIFLDDVQWADEGSVKLIQTFLRDTELENVMLILAYRDEESAQVFHETGVLAVAPDCTTDIALANLDETSVHEIVKSNIVQAPSSDEDHQLRALSVLVARRTEGNPLYVKMFLDTIKKEGLLLYDDEVCSWLFSVDEIQKTIMVSETLADLLTRKIQRFPRELKETLKIASLLGYRFMESILLHVVRNSTMHSTNQSYNIYDGLSLSEQSSQRSVSLSLSEAVKEGFIEQTADGFQFAHDKIQTAFRFSIDEDGEAKLHRLIGEAFLAHKDERKSNIYRAATHLNNALELAHNKHQRIKLAQISLEAAKYCIEMSSFDKAVIVLQKGLRALCPKDRWSGEYLNINFEMTEALARAQLVVGDFAGCKETTREALSHGRIAHKNVNLLSIDVEVRMAGNEVDAAIATANQALGVLGVKMPYKVGIRHILAKLAKVKVMLRQRTDEELLSLPVAHDLLSVHAVKLLMHICTYCIIKDEADLAVYSALVATHLTLKNGLSQHSPCAFAIYGVAEVSLGNIARAYRFGKLALVMLDQIHAKEVECPTVAYALTLISARKEKIHELVQPLHQVAHSGFQHGEILYATYCAGQSYSMHVQIGTNLSHLETAIQKSYSRILNLGQDALLGWLQPTFQYILNMQTDISDWDNIANLSGEIMDEEEYFCQAFQTNHTAFAMLGLLWKAKLAVEFGLFAVAVSIFEGCKQYSTDYALRLSWGAPMYYLDQALAYYGLFELSGRRHHLRVGHKYHRLLQRMHNAGCPNASPHFAFLVAWGITLGKKSVKESVLRDAYKTGIASLVAAKFPNLEALLSERAGFEFAKLGVRADAEHYFDRALHIYQNEWGAIAKYNQLKQTSASALLAMQGHVYTNGIHGRCICVPLGHV